MMKPLLAIWALLVALSCAEEVVVEEEDATSKSLRQRTDLSSNAKKRAPRIMAFEFGRGDFDEEDEFYANVAAIKKRKGVRDLKGSKGASKGDVQHEEILKFSINQAEVDSAVIDTGDGYTFRVRVYQGDTKQEVGFWYERIVYTELVSDPSQGAGTVIVTFNRNSAISLQGALNQKQLPITGGSGEYQYCPGGYAHPVKQQGEIITFNFFIAFTC